MPVAELQNVTKRFGNVTALDGLSLEVESGELVSLLGANGAGKTTAVRLLLGLSKPSAGAARIFSEDPRQRSARTRVGAMLQVAKVPDLLKVREHIALFSSYYPKPLPMADIIEAAGLNGIENRLFGDLSGGQKQRVLFALAICGDPQLLFLDEPTVGMDIEARRALWRVIRGFVQRGGSVLLTTHYLEEADSLSDRVIVINRGKVVAQGTPAELKQANTGRRIKCVTRLALDVVRNVSGVRHVRQDGVALDIVSDRPEQTVRELLALDEELFGLEVISQALDDAYLSLVNNSQQPEEVLQ
jgi:ABC-2 type transport system ATP-binding protein